MAVNTVVALALLLGSLPRLESVVCNLPCDARPMLTCGLNQPATGSTGTQIAFNLTRQSRNAHLEIAVTTEAPDDSLEIEAIPPACSLTDAERITIVYGRTWPTVSIAASAIPSDNAVQVLEVRGPIQLDSLLKVMQGLQDLKAASANLSKPISSLARLRNLIADVTVWRPVAGSDAGLLTGMPLLTSAKFSGGRLGRLRKGDFVELPELRYLYLVQCGVTALDADVFETLAESRLSHLIIEDNSIETLPRYVFKALSNSLQQLRLARNGLLVIDADAFAGLAALEQLDLSANRLTSLAPSTFAGLGRLRSLDLSVNPQLIVISSADLTASPATRIFCPLENLATLSLDLTANLDCREFASGRVRILTTSRAVRRRRVLLCDWIVGSWCTQSSDRQHEKRLATEGQQLLKGSVQQQQQQPTSLLLLMILGSVSLAHLVVVLVIVAMCRRFGAARSCGHCSPDRSKAAAARLAVELAEGGENGGCGTYSLAGGSGGGGGDGGVGHDSLVATNSDSAAAVLVSFQSKKMGDELEDEAFDREKTCYQFNEDA